MKKQAIGPEVIEHSYSLVRNEHFSAMDFYSAIEQEIQAQKMPGLRFSRVEFLEAGVLSDRREYLRLQREELMFDICAAPVGINYFFSYRFHAKEPEVGVFEFVGLSVIMGMLWGFLALFNPTVGSGIFVAICLLGLLLLMAKASHGDDELLLSLPMIGPIYARFFRKDTYYRQDMRIAYCSIVSGIVKAEIERVTAEKGVKLLREHTYSPVMQGLYTVKESVPKPSERTVPQVSAEPPAAESPPDDAPPAEELPEGEFPDDQPPRYIRGLGNV